MTNGDVSRRVDSERWRVFLQVVAVIVAIEIALHSFIVKEPVLTLVGAGLWFGGSFWTRQRGTGGPLLIGVLATFEVVATVFFSEEFAARSEIPGWVLPVHLVLVSTALLSVVMTIVKERSDAPPHHPLDVG